MRLVGAGLGRTGTHSLKLALERLLDRPCYHMMEVFQNQDHIPLWAKAVNGEPVDWDSIFDGYAATVDWPGAAFWRDLTASYPEAVVLLSTRDDADAWWRSASNTIFEVSRRSPPPAFAPMHDMVLGLLTTRFTPAWSDEQEAKAAYERHNAEVRSSIADGRLVDWRPGDGWEPLCQALGVPVPDEPFPHVNTTEDFRAMMGFDRPES